MEQKRKILLIVNPVAGKGKTMELLPRLSQFFKDHEQEIEIKIIISRFKGDISNEAKLFYHKGYREFLALGGDGTLSELVNAFDIETMDPITLGIIPYGTGNDFVKTIYPEYVLEHLLDSIVENKKMRIDVGKVNGFYFINSCTFGIDGPIIERTDRLKRFVPGSPAYLLSTLHVGLTFKPSYTEITVDGKQYNGHTLIIAIGNGAYIGGGMKICPEANLQDGKFDICLISNISKLKFMKEIGRVYKGTLDQVEEVTYVKGESIDIQTKGRPYYINVDGNLLGQTPANIKMLKNAITFYKI